MHCVSICKENAILLKATPAVDYRKIRSKFQGKATREQISEFTDGSMRRVWRYI